MEGWIRELRLAVRSLVGRPGFAALAIVTLALGIGANTAIFSVIHGSLLRPLPYADSDRLEFEAETETVKQFTILWRVQDAALQLAQVSWIHPCAQSKLS